MKCISIILILSFLYYCLGCYKTKIIKQEDEISDRLKAEEMVESPGAVALIYAIKQKDKIRDYLDTGHWVYILNNDSLKYFFNAGKYHIVNDTLQGGGQQVIGDQKQGLDQIRIALSDILEIEVDEDSEMFKHDNNDHNIHKVLLVVTCVGTVALCYWLYNEMKKYGK